MNISIHKTDREAFEEAARELKISLVKDARNPEQYAFFARKAWQIWQAACRSRDEEIQRLEKLVYVPGLWKCAKCNCTTVCTNLHVNTGEFSANNSPQQCPNKCGPMWRVTERDSGNEMTDKYLTLKRQDAPTLTETEAKRIIAAATYQTDFPGEKAVADLRIAGMKFANDTNVASNNQPSGEQQ